jgi:hypothetical protein
MKKRKKSKPNPKKPSKPGQPVSRKPKPKPKPKPEPKPKRSKARSRPRPRLPDLPPILLEGDDWMPQGAAVTPSLPEPVLEDTERVPNSSEERIPALNSEPGLVEQPIESPPTSGSMDKDEGSSGAFPGFAEEPFRLHASWHFVPHGSSASNPAPFMLRLRQTGVSGPWDATMPCPPDSNEAFLEAPHAGTAYVAELGRFDETGAWDSWAESNVAWTFGEPSSERWVELALPEAGVKLENPPANVSDAASTMERPAEPSPNSTGPVSKSVELTVPPESIPPRVLLESPVPDPTTINVPVLPSSGVLVAPQATSAPHSFWFQANLELVVYGATEPGSNVVLAGRSIQLRTDGTFTVRLALPDGFHTLPAQATSPDGQETRCFEFELYRLTRVPNPEA